MFRKIVSVSAKVIARIVLGTAIACAAALAGLYAFAGLTRLLMRQTGLPVDNCALAALGLVTFFIFIVGNPNGNPHRKPPRA